MMTINQFLEEVSKYEWQLITGHIRSKEIMSGEDIHGSFEYPGCPLTYIAYKLTGKTYRTNNYIEAAEALDLEYPRMSAQDIAKAADDPVWIYSSLRLRLERAAGV